MKAPFPYFGGKSRVAPVVWERFGDVKNYIEPFAGSLAVLLHRASPAFCEFVNDMDGLLINFWRACKANPQAIVELSETPPSEIDLVARHNWVTKRKDAIVQMQADPEYYDIKTAAYWLYARCWFVGGRGFMQDPIKSRRPETSWLGCYRGKGQNVAEELDAVSRRLRGVHIFCGDWRRVLTEAVLAQGYPAGIFIDPPYSFDANRDMGCYTVDSGTVAHDVRAWCLENGNNAKLRIALCGYDREHNELEEHGWSAVKWSTQGGMAHLGKCKGLENRHREVIWFSPHCLKEQQPRLF